MIDKYDKDPKAVLREILERAAPQPSYVIFLDMLGFSDLTEAQPDAIKYDWDKDDYDSIESTSDSAEQIGRFQTVLNNVAMNTSGSMSPSHLMLFSDCAFMVYGTALSAAESSTIIMRYCFQQAVPVRMGLASGTWNASRFSFDSVKDLVITRAVFYGTGVVRATKAEKKGGKGCRIFLHRSLDDKTLALIGDSIGVLPTPEHSDIAPLELNYLAPVRHMSVPSTNDSGISSGFKKMRGHVSESAEDGIKEQYIATADALNRMCAQLNRPRLDLTPDHLTFS